MSRDLAEERADCFEPAKSILIRAIREIRCSNFFLQNHWMFPSRARGSKSDSLTQPAFTFSPRMNFS